EGLANAGMSAGFQRLQQMPDAFADMGRHAQAFQAISRTIRPLQLDASVRQFAGLGDVLRKAALPLDNVRRSIAAMGDSSRRAAAQLYQPEGQYGAILSRRAREERDLFRRMIGADNTTTTAFEKAIAVASGRKPENKRTPGDVRAILEAEREKARE